MVDLKAEEGASITETDAVARRLEALLANTPGLDSQAAYIGSGAPRYFCRSMTESVGKFCSFVLNAHDPGRARADPRALARSTPPRNFPMCAGG